MAVEGEFPKVDGDILYASEVNGFHDTDLRTSNIVSQQAEQNINILVNSAAVSSVLNPYDDMVLDIFSVAAGYDGTVDTTNTTANFDTDEYNFVQISEPYIIIEADDDDLSAYDNVNTRLLKIDTGKWIMFRTVSETEEVSRAQLISRLFYMSNTGSVSGIAQRFTNITSIQTSVTRDVGKRAHAWYTYNTNGPSGTNALTGTFADTTNNTNCSSWSALSSYGVYNTGLYWEIASGTVRNSNTAGTGTVSEIGTDTSGDEINNPANCRVRGTWSASDDTGRTCGMILAVGAISWAVSSGTIAGHNEIDWLVDYGVPAFTAVSGGVPDITYIIQTNAETITADPIAHQFYCHNTITSGTMKYDVSFDGGSTWDTDQEFNTYNTTTQTGSSMILKIKLEGGATTGDMSINDYAAMLFY